MNARRADVCVIGGGPAGASLARRAAMLGHSVVVIEKAPFPRPHIGESLTGAVLPLLDVLAMREQVESAGFYRPRGALVRWAEQRTVYREAPGPAGFQVDRARFDRLLLQQAEAAGAVVLQPARLLGVQELDSCGWEVRIRSATGPETILAKMLADASGRNAVVRGKKLSMSRRTLAISGYWRDVPITGIETRIESGAEEWYWGAPLPDGEFNATIFIDAPQFQPPLKDFYLARVGKSHLLKEALGGRLVRGPKICDATCYLDTEPAAINRIKAGEAAFTLDPLSSQGVVAAIGSGLHAASVLHTILERPRDAVIAVEFYRSRLRRSAMFHAEAACEYYTRAAAFHNSAFWMRRSKAEPPTRPVVSARIRAGSDELVMRAAEMRIGPVPIIEGDFITQTLGIFAPRLPEPAVFLGQVAIAPLFASITQPTRLSDVLSKWAQVVSFRTASQILSWALANEILTTCSVDGSSCSWPERQLEPISGD
jgi:flavin-dependent dehydrogenase